MLLALVGLLACYFALELMHGITHAKEESHFEPLRKLALVLSTLGAHVLAARLVTREYAARTQLFLETLPVTRARILTTKLLLGTGLIVALLAAAAAVCVLTAPAGTPLPPRFLGLMFVRALTLSLQGYALLFLGGLLGRYRVPLLLLAVIALFAVDHLTALDLGEVGPAALMRDDFGFEQHQLPLRDVALGWAQVASCVGLAYALALPRDGTLTALMSERMSHREKVFVACVVLGAISAIWMMDEAQPKPPYVLHVAARAEEGGAWVEVAPGQGVDTQQAAALAARLAHELATAQDYLALPELPGVFVVPTREVGPDVFERAELDEADGVLVRANLAHRDFDARGLVGFVLREALLWSSEGRLAREERQWVLDGFSAGWASREQPDSPLLLRALWAARELPPDATVLLGWLRTREQLGPCVAGGVAHAALGAVVREAGPERTRDFLRRALAPPSGTPAWAALTAPDVAQLLRETTGLELEALLAGWRAHLDEAGRTHAAALAALPRLVPRAELHASSEATWELRHALQVEGGEALPPRYALVYKQLGAFDAEVPGPALERQEVLLATEGEARQPHTLPRTLARGERWLWAFELRSAALGCAMRAGAERRELP